MAINAGYICARGEILAQLVAKKIFTLVKAGETDERRAIAGATVTAYWKYSVVIHITMRYLK
jgi:hypothetical protein